VRSEQVGIPGLLVLLLPVKGWSERAPGTLRPMARLQIWIASTRPGRIGLPVARWFEDEARAHAGFAEIDVLDLAELDLPFLDEPNHPRLQQYTQEHTKRWSATASAQDAFAFVMPEYNFGFNAPLKNALDYLHLEWRHKPVGLVTYGGVSAGTRAGQMITEVLRGLSMHPLYEAVHIPFVRQFLSEDGRIEPNDAMRAGARGMLDELVRVESALRPLRS
jgi:NAD(P)H-dependent FMN reductase